MIGNDIIDLKLALSQTRAENLRFQKKIFTRNEQEFIQNSTNPEVHLWLLWSIKEAVYKAHQRIFKLPRKLNPIKIECTPITYSKNIMAGLGKVDGINYKTSSYLTSDYIHSISHLETKQDHYVKIVSEPINLKQDMIHEFSSRNLVLKEQLQIIKDRYSIPFFSLKNKKLNTSFSISHHGNFAAYIFPLIKY